MEINDNVISPTKRTARTIQRGSGETGVKIKPGKGPKEDWEEFDLTIPKSGGSRATEYH